MYKFCKFCFLCILFCFLFPNIVFAANCPPDPPEACTYKLGIDISSSRIRITPQAINFSEEDIISGFRTTFNGTISPRLNLNFPIDRNNIRSVFDSSFINLSLTASPIDRSFVWKPSLEAQLRAEIINSECQVNASACIFLRPNNQVEIKTGYEFIYTDRNGSESQGLLSLIYNIPDSRNRIQLFSPLPDATPFEVSISITATPIPSTFWLFGSALFYLFFLNKRRILTNCNQRGQTVLLH